MAIKLIFCDPLSKSIVDKKNNLILQCLRWCKFNFPQIALVYRHSSTFLPPLGGSKGALETHAHPPDPFYFLLRISCSFFGGGMAKIVRWRPHLEGWNIAFVKLPRFFVCRNRKCVVMYLYRYKRKLKFLKKRYKEKSENAYLTVKMQELGRQLLTLLSGQHCRKSFWSPSTNPGFDSVVCIKRTATKTLITK